MPGQHLFSGPFLSDRLQGHKNALIREIQSVACLSELTDRFLESIVARATVKPLVLKTSEMKKAIRKEQIPGSRFPFEFGMMDEQLQRTYPRMVACIKLPFEGEEDALKCRPSTFGLRLPQAEVVGRRIEFDVIFWGRESDADDVKRTVREQVELIESYMANVNKDMAAFNLSVASEMKKAFQAKLAQLTSEISTLDDLGIADDEEEPSAWTAPPSRARSKSATKAKPVTVQYVTMYVDRLFAENLNQTNSNTGDVNNAIQSNE